MMGVAKKANIPEEELKKCHVYEAHSNKFYKDLPPDHNVLSINEFFVIYMEKTPDEELEEETPKYLSAFHFDKEPAKIHGIPFRFTVREGEVFKDTKERLSKRMGIKGKQFEKIKFALVPKQAYPKPEYLDDSECLRNYLHGGFANTELRRRDLRADQRNGQCLAWLRPCE
jgi:ubiquitin carboxyl-terminal hydrolase 7